MYVVTYFTNDLYRSYAEQMIASVERFGFEGMAVKVPNLGSWRANTEYKCRFLYEALDRLQQDLLWLDADSKMVNKPVLLKEVDGHIACYWDETGNPATPGTPFSGTLLVRNTDPARWFLRRWDTLNKTSPKEQDDRNVRAAFESTPDNPTVKDGVTTQNPYMKVTRLPVEYCWAEHLMAHRHPNANPVILQFMVSREKA